MKNIFKTYLATALVALALTSCTDEADVLDNKPIKNKKTGEENLRPYLEFEEINIEAENVISLLSDFNKAMKDEISMPNMQIDTALLLMETYFNYGIVDKQSEYDLADTYDETSFDLTLNLQNEIELNGSYLKEQFTNFLDSVKSSMSGKYLKFSDIYVSDYDGISITFTLVIPPYTQDEYEMWPYGVPVVRVLKTPLDPINIPSYYNIIWMGPGEPTIYRDYRLANLCLKTEAGFYNSFKWRPYHISGYLWKECQDWEDYVRLTNENLTNYVIPTILTKLDTTVVQYYVPTDEKIVKILIDIGYELNYLNRTCGYASLSGILCSKVSFGYYFTQTLESIIYN